jgi:hypothetical protein
MAKFQVLSSEQPQVTLPVVTNHYAGHQTLFKYSNWTIPQHYWALGIHSFFGLHATTIPKNIPAEENQQ